MKTVRFGTFETNSSSCHSLTVMRKQDWEDFKNYKKFINSSIDRTDSDDGYYGLEAQFLNPDVFIDLDELKKKLSEIDPEGSKFMEDMTSEDIQVEMNKRGSKLRDYIYDLHENDLEVYDDDDECGWGMAKVIGSNFGGDTEVVAVSREICC